MEPASTKMGWQGGRVTPTTYGLFQGTASLQSLWLSSRCENVSPGGAASLSPPLPFPCLALGSHLIPDCHLIRCLRIVSPLLGGNVPAGSERALSPPRLSILAEDSRKHFC